MVVNGTVGHSMSNIMDPFSNYNEIKMYPHNIENTAFRTSMGNLHYSFMPFILKNVEATYQRAMTVRFHSMLHD